MKFLFLLLILFLSGCTNPSIVEPNEVSVLENKVSVLEEKLGIYEAAEAKRSTRLLLDGQTNRQLLKDAKELMLNMWQASTFCGEYALCDSACDFGDYSKSDYLEFCNAYYYSFKETDYDEIELRLEEILN